MSRAESLVGCELGGTYRVQRLVAAGGMGEVYEATHARLAGRYAIKVLLPEFAGNSEVVARFRREAEITAQLRHPNIVSVLDFDTTPDGRAFLAMELLLGHDLAHELAQVGALPIERVGDIVGQVVGALARAHAQGVVHRDLKPQNLFVVAAPGDDRVLVKILDFGISKLREAQTQLTQMHALIGTPHYMAPEQALAAAPIDHRADQWALAAIAYELLAGRTAFRGDSIPSLLYQVVHAAPAPLATLRADVSPELAAVIERALAKRPEDRWENIRAFGQAVEAAVRTSAPRALLPIAVVPEAGGLAPADSLAAHSPAPIQEVDVGDEPAAGLAQRIGRWPGWRRVGLALAVALVAAGVVPDRVPESPPPPTVKIEPVAAVVRAKEPQVPRPRPPICQLRLPVRPPVRIPAAPPPTVVVPPPITLAPAPAPRSEPASDVPVEPRPRSTLVACREELASYCSPAPATESAALACLDQVKLAPHELTFDCAERLNARRKPGAPSDATRAPLLGSCAAEVAHHCGATDVRTDLDVIACFKRKELALDALPGACGAGVFRVLYVLARCQPDLERYCATDRVDDGIGLATCVRANRAAFSADCRRTLARVPLH